MLSAGPWAPSPLCADMQRAAASVAERAGRPSQPPASAVRQRHAFAHGELQPGGYLEDGGSSSVSSKRAPLAAATSSNHATCSWTGETRSW